MFIKKRGIGKKGALENILFFLIDLIVVVIVFFLMMGYVDKVVESTTFEKNFLARDTALLIDTLYVSPGNIVVDYPQDTFWFNFNFEKNKVEVYEDSLLLIKKPSSYFIEDRNMEFVYKEIKPEKKVEDKKSFIEKYFSPLSYFYTSKPKLEEGTFVKLVFGKQGKEIVVDKKEEVKIESKLLECDDIETETVAGAPPVISWLVPNPNSLNQGLVDMIDNAHISVITFVGNNPDNTINSIKAYIPIEETRYKKSKRLACIILNNIITNDELKDVIKKNNLIDVTGISIIPSDFFSILKKGNIIVLIEIGNINIEENRNLIYNHGSVNAIQESINRAIETMLK